MQDKIPHKTIHIYNIDIHLCMCVNMHHTKQVVNTYGP